MSEQLYYIATKNHEYIWPGGVILWWGPDASGYSTTLDMAGKYTYERASKICGKGQRGGDFMVPVEKAEAVRVVDIDKLRELT